MIKQGASQLLNSSTAVRDGGHRQEIMNSSTAVGKHFASCGLENMQIQIIDSVREGEIMALLNLEGYCQNILFWKRRGVIGNKY